MVYNSNTKYINNNFSLFFWVYVHKVSVLQKFQNKNFTRFIVKNDVYIYLKLAIFRV